MRCPPLPEGGAPIQIMPLTSDSRSLCPVGCIYLDQPRDLAIFEIAGDGMLALCPKHPAGLRQRASRSRLASTPTGAFVATGWTWPQGLSCRVAGAPDA